MMMQLKDYKPSVILPNLVAVIKLPCVTYPSEVPEIY